MADAATGASPMRRSSSAIEPCIRQYANTRRSNHCFSRVTHNPCRGISFRILRMPNGTAYQRGSLPMRYGVVIISTAIFVLIGFVTWAERYPSIEPVGRSAVSGFGSSLISKGRVLVALGDCAVCHTTSGGKPFAGGLKLPTPFGAIYSTNITPDLQTGIGQWSEAAFARALREGVNRSGNYLYPAFPYDHFTKVTDQDIEAIYAYLMTRTPVATMAPPNELSFPINYRIVMAVWNLFFLDNGVLAPDPSKTAQWNRGAYLVEGLGHCGGCHTPRNLMGAEKRGQRYAGGEVEGWYAPALNDASPAPLPWMAEALVNYFLDGWDKGHGIAAGPMTEVANGLAALSEADASAIAVYILSMQGEPRPQEPANATIAFARERGFGGAGPQVADGTDANLEHSKALFAKICSNCHRAGGAPAALALTSTVNGPDPRNLIRVIIEGIQPPEGVPDRSMPAFGRSLSDADLIGLVAFMRRNFSQQPAWRDLEAQVGRIRAASD
jgi:mono/diheme cytochrome c family protein